MMTTRVSCRVCRSRDLRVFLRLSETPLADAFVERENEAGSEPRFPLDVAVCEDCNLVMLVGVVSRELLFGENYAFYTSGSPQAVLHFRRYAQEVMRRYPELGGQLVVEIASNDGVLLRPLRELGAKVLGIEPARNVAPVAQGAGIRTLIEFFGRDCARKVASEHGKAGLLLANNVVAHVDDLDDFLEGVKLILDPQGVLIFEVHYFPNLLFRNQFDNIYHEHRSFFSLRPLIRLFTNAGMKVFDVEEVDTQGGSIRVYCSFGESEHVIQPIVQKMAQSELDLELDKIETYMSLRTRVLFIKRELTKILGDLKQRGQRIVGYGAPAKGNTLLNYCGIGTQYLDYIVDKTLYKHGKLTPGMHVPVYPMEKIQEDGPPDYYLMLVWNYAAGIFRQEEEFRRAGGRFIIPIPIPHLI